MNTPAKALSLSRTRYIGALSPGNAPVIWHAQQLPSSVAENKKCEELLQGNRRNHKEINRSGPVSAVAKEGLPCLRRSTSPRYHVLRDSAGRLRSLQKLTVDVRRTPERVLETHSSDKVVGAGLPPLPRFRSLVRFRPMLLSARFLPLEAAFELFVARFHQVQS